MTKKEMYGVGGIALFTLVTVLLVVGNGPSDAQSTTTQPAVDKVEASVPKAEKVEVFVFHSTQRCISCITIGKFTKETIDIYFQTEVQEGKIDFREINVDLPENRELARKFGATGSSLYINAIYDGKDHISQDIQVWRLVRNNFQFKAYLKNKLDTLLEK